MRTLELPKGWICEEVAPGYPQWINETGEITISLTDDGGGFYFNIIHYEDCSTRDYQDWKEFEIGDGEIGGVKDTDLRDAMWYSMRILERWNIMQDIYAREMDEQMLHSLPSWELAEYDPKWWVN